MWRTGRPAQSDERASPFMFLVHRVSCSCSSGVGKHGKLRSQNSK